MNNTNIPYPPKKIVGFPGLSSFTLHIMAMLLMLMDHTWAMLLPGCAWLTCVGRVAYPIFAFMIVEGYFHTSDLKKYLTRLFLFAMISEIPFNLVYSGNLFYLFHQNVLWTFLIGLLIIRWLEHVRGKYRPFVYFAAIAAASAVGFILGTVLMVDYHGAGILILLMFYVLHKRTLLNFILQLLFMYYVFVELIGGYYYPIEIFGHPFELQQEAFSLLALIPIWLYKGRQGYHAPWFRWFCYAFYPVHLLVLYFLWFITK